ncbi:hypothetical protein PVAP13_5NG186562 [Panicum virgatum]|uniref:Protein argonaute Mid domain-containing protein n=1 Tax=Panicum virgatum TaxID=38727 RepID=A0A8T0RS51_PANVG|nr:hypothetical protein PVAP13_5NG186562 [Panicum virgatum]
MLRRCGISIAPEFAQVDGRILQAPMLKAGNNQELIARNGRWNFNNKKLIEPEQVNRWAAVNFSTRWNVQDLVQCLIRCGEMKGIKIEPAHTIFEESLQMREPSGTPENRVDNMIKQLKQRLPKLPNFLLCVLPVRKNCDIYDELIIPLCGLQIVANLVRALEAKISCGIRHCYIMFGT